MDGLDLDQKIVYEVKNRARGLFGCVRDYEKIQAMAYLLLFPDCVKAVLVEAFKTEYRMDDVFLEEVFLSDVEKSFVVFFRILSSLLSDETMRRQLWGTGFGFCRVRFQKTPKRLRKQCIRQYNSLEFF